MTLKCGCSNEAVSVGGISLRRRPTNFPWDEGGQRFRISKFFGLKGGREAVAARAVER